MSTPADGAQPYYPPVEGIGITFRCSSVDGNFYDLFKPKIFVDGVEIPVQGWGHADLLVPAGRHDVHVYTKYWFPSEAGLADYTVEVPSGQFVELEYRAPLFKWSRGSLGPPPQRYQGVWPLVALIGGGLLFIALMLLLSAL
jgi:hypothetical protein